MNGHEAQDDRPRYVVIGDLLQRRVETGVYPLGTLLPTESDLCAEFGLSRHTVREALRRVAETGLIQRRQGSGSLVVATQAHQTYVHTMRSLNELFQYASDTRFRIRSVQMVVPGDEHLTDLGSASQDNWLCAEGLRLERGGDVAICFARVFINRDFAAVANNLSAISGAIYRHLEERFGVEVALVEQDIRVIPIPLPAAQAMNQKIRSWAVRVVRRYLDAEGRLLLASVNDHPADRFSYSMRLRREGPKGVWS
jgi:GntR family transcriptional regulator